MSAMNVADPMGVQRRRQVPCVRWDVGRRAARLEGRAGCVFGDGEIKHEKEISLF